MREEMSSARSAPSIAKPYGGEKPLYYDVSHYKSEGELGKYPSDGNMAAQKDILLQRSEEEGFGFVILSTGHMVGSTIGEFSILTLTIELLQHLAWAVGPLHASVLEQKFRPFLILLIISNLLHPPVFSRHFRHPELSLSTFKTTPVAVVS